VNKTSLRISGVHYDTLKKHLFPGDGLEAVAFAICGRHREEGKEILSVRRIVPVPHNTCKRAKYQVAWPTDILAQFLDEARRYGLGVIKFHSHPETFDEFSDTDDESDLKTFSSVFSWLEDGKSHGSAVMLPDGRIFGRSIQRNGWQPFFVISVIANDISYWHSETADTHAASAFEAQIQIFGAGTTARLRKLSVGVVGCSGTGSIVVELLARLGVGAFVLVDHDTIEERNLNRILNSKRGDVGKSKVEILDQAVKAMGFDTRVLPLKMNLFTPIAVRAIADCDVVFGCMDTAEGRHLLNRIATFYLIPYFDLGVHLASDGKGGIDEASGVVHYLQPGRSSLLSRKAFSLERVRAENLYRTDPKAYKEQFHAGYIEGVIENSPAVAGVNATIASLAINEFLARIHPYRSCSNSDCSIIRFNFMETSIFREEEGDPCPVLLPHIGKGDVDPLLDMPALSN